MKYLVIANFRCKPGMAQRMAERFVDALPVTRSFQGLSLHSRLLRGAHPDLHPSGRLGFSRGIRGLPRVSRRHGHSDAAGSPPRRGMGGGKVQREAARKNSASL